MSGAAEAFVCKVGEHHWVFSHEPHAPIWIVSCTFCGRHNFTEMLAAHDAEVARKTLEDAADELGVTADKYGATAERLDEEQQYGDSIRYSNYATAYRASSHKVRARAASISTDKAGAVDGADPV